MSERVKLGILSALLLVVLVILAFTAVNTIHAVRNFQQQNNAARLGDVHAIRSWMTIHAIAHFYHVPEDYLYRSLHIDNPVSYRRATLYTIAQRQRQPVDQVIRTVQHAILTYRNAHPRIATPLPKPPPGARPLSPTPGRTEY